MGIWSKVLIIAAYVLVAFIGNLPVWMNAASAIVVGVVLGYLLYRERKGFSLEFVRGNLLYIFPGHIIILLAMTIAKGMTVTVPLWIAWVMLMLSTLAFDFVAQFPGWEFDMRRKGVMVLYPIVWGLIFFLVHQLLSAGGGLDEGGVIIATIIMVPFALAFIGMALYRFTKLEPAQE